MEPLPGRHTEGLAPILGWNNDSPSLSPALTPKTPAGADDTPTSPQNKSVTSSGIGPDSPSRTVSFSSSDFSPTQSSIGCKPPAVWPSAPLAEFRQILQQQNNRSTPPPVQNGDVLSVETTPLRTVITENPMYDEAVIKFQDVQDDKNPDADGDSICSSSNSESGDDEEADRRSKIS